uniref:Phytanoyl-CoA dioxygenase family protein n=1 Tax=Plectus sambesii TaxID=2011161 RepID=A0A914VDI6_9BILA
KQAGQTCADLERVDLILKTLEHVHVDLAAGDAVLFHANMLHKSEPNVSAHRRWNLIFSFNTKQNSPDRKHYNAQYSPLDKVPADAVIKCESLEVQHREYLDPTTNPNVTVLNQNH